MQHQFEAYYNSNNGTGIYCRGIKSFIRIDRIEGAIKKLDDFLLNHSHSFIAIALSYELKNDIEALHSSKPDKTNFPAFIAVVPQSIYKFKNGKVKHQSGKKINPEILKNITSECNKNYDRISFRARTSKERYLSMVEKLKSHIQNGDIYEVNYCQEYFAENIEIKNPFSLFNKVNAITKAPYAVYFNFDEYFVMSGSPERFVQKKGRNLISQPIKGTIKRGSHDDEDRMLKEKLYNDPKERSENVMIVDLVRNDLSKLAKKNSVKVDELFSIYTFQTVHQMISTVSCDLREDLSFADIIKATFPMGSMTGAPKISAMNLINKYEDFARGIYSGSIGYLKPNGDFDLNVIIRTLIYNSDNKYLSCPVGGAITIKSDPENEYNECIVKVGKILETLGNE